jgi:hypothetical protein
MQNNHQIDDLLQVNYISQTESNSVWYILGLSIFVIPIISLMGNSSAQQILTGITTIYYLSIFLKLRFFTFGSE